MWRDLPRDVCLKADYKDMLTNAAVQVVCTQTVAQHGHRKTHTDAPDAHKHTHTRTIPLRNCPVLVFKFDSDLTDLGHLALAAEQTAWLHLCACVCFHISVCVSIPAEDTFQNRQTSWEGRDRKMLTTISQLETCKTPRTGRLSLFAASRHILQKFLQLLALNVLPASSSWNQLAHIT